MEGKLTVFAIVLAAIASVVVVTLALLAFVDWTMGLLCEGTEVIAELVCALVQ